MTGNRFHLGIDVGGTFTDAVLICEETGRIDTAKVPSTPADPSIGFMAAVARALENGAVDPGAISHLVHGTTVATNSLIEGKTPKTAFVTTEGFGDMLEIARQVRPSLYDVHFEKLRPARAARPVLSRCRSGWTRWAACSSPSMRTPSGRSPRRCGRRGSGPSPCVSCTATRLPFTRSGWPRF